ncbi:general substrate transporter [Aspergillus steynii IBT 23096]|uniref:General substrate transporter n=1 Tax=Aspergillus steynii IBT 23096 TaxID=1392250 RepID=A0A2I2GSA5_9EURO|nr:general substrate transporter [Aspergillus steynii IBT 23096]PLB55757.1 general substrate transporter [Aspergillus steynii IBT 23096]
MLFKSKTFNLWFCCLVAGGCMVLNGYDSSSFNAVQGSDDFMEYFHHPSPSVIGSVNTAYTVAGVVSGFFISAPISDYFGRKWTMYLGCAFVIVSSLVSAFTPRTMGGFIAGRALTGIGQGLAMPAGPVYINEMAPAEKRGMIMSFWQLFFGVGSFLAYWINYACTEDAERLGHWNWRIVILLQMLAPVLVISGLLFCPESPRWYIQKDRTEDAIQALQVVRDDPEQVASEIREILQAIRYEKETNPGRYAPLWKDKAIRKRFLLACGLNIGQQFTGQGSLTMYSTLIYKKVFTENKQIQLINALNGTFGILFTLNATWMVDRFGRRALLLIGAAGMSLCMIVVAATVTETPELADGAKSKPVGIATVFLMFLFALFYKPSWGATVWIWSSEIFSMNIRSQAIGMATQSQSVSNTILQQIFPIFLDKKGFYAMYMFGAINVVLFAFVWFCIPETKGVALEHVDTLFGGLDHAEQGAEMVDYKQDKSADATVLQIEDTRATK